MTALPLAAASAGIIIGVVAFLAITIAVGVFTVRLVKGSSRRYIVAGQSLPLFFVGTMLAAQSIDGNGTLGNSGLAYEGGFWAGAMFPLSLFFCLMITGAVFAKRLNRMSLLTLPDFYYRRYGNLTEGLSGLLMLISFVVLVAGNLAATAFILKAVFGTSFLVALLIGATIILIYTSAGGLFSCAYTDIFQIYIAIAGFWIAFAYIGLGFTGHSMSEMIGNVPDGYLDFSGLTQRSNGALLNWGTLFAVGLGDIIALDFMERVFAARDGRTAARGAYWGGTLTALVAIPVAFIGIFGFTLMPGATSSFLVYPEIAVAHVPAWVGVFMLIGVLGASMSTANGGILALSSVISRNLIQRQIQGKLLKRPKMGNRTLLRTTRFLLIPVLIGSLILAYYKPQPGTLLALAFDIVLAGCFAPLLLGLYWKKANMPAAVASIVIGSILRLIGFYATPADWAGIESMLPVLISFVVFYSVAMATQTSHPGELLHGVVDYVPSEDDIVEGEDLRGYTPPVLKPSAAGPAV